MRLVVIGAMCILPFAAVLTILQGLPWSLPRWIDSAVNDVGGWMLLAGLLSFALTPVTVGIGAWSIFKSKIDRRIRVVIACFVLAQVATALSLLAMAFVGGIGSGGRLPH